MGVGKLDEHDESFTRSCAFARMSGGSSHSAFSAFSNRIPRACHSGILTSLDSFSSAGMVHPTCNKFQTVLPPG